MANYYNYIDDTIGLGASTIARIQATGAEYGVVTSQDITARVITASQFVGPGIGTEGGAGIGLTDLSVTINPAGINSLTYNDVTGVFQFTPASFVGYATEGYVDSAVVGFVTSGIVVGYATEGYVDTQVGLVTAGLASETYVDNLVAISTFSGDYNDLSNKPTIPSDTGDLTNSVGFVTSSVVVGYATEGYVDNLVAISTFSGDYGDLTNQPTIPVNLTDLSDVNAGSPSMGQVLKWSGSEWTAAEEGGVYTPYTIWVSPTGDDGYSGTTRAVPKKTIKGAVGVATEGTIIRVSPGTYIEDNPITLPKGVSIEGDNLRNCVVSPANDDDLFYVNDGCYIGDLSFSGSANSNAVVSFDPVGVGTITKSPYIRNCTNFIPDSIGMRIDGSLASGSNGVNGSMVCDSYTQYNQGGIGVTITNNAYAQLVSIFTICCDTAIFTGSGGQCDITNSNSSFGNFGLVSSGVGSTEFIGSVHSSATVNDNEIVVSGVGTSRPYTGQVVYFDELYYNVESITVTNGGSGYSIAPVVTISSPTGPNSIAAQAFATIENGSVTQVTIISSGSNYRLSDSPIVSFSTGTASATVNLSPLYYKVRSATLPSSGITTVTLSRTFDNNIGIGSTVPFSRQSLQIVSSHSFEYIGSGTDILTARPSLGGVTITENEIVKLNGGDIVYTSTDQDGNFKIGDGLTIDQAGGVISGRSFDKSLLSKVTPFILALS